MKIVPQKGLTLAEAGLYIKRLVVLSPTNLGETARLIREIAPIADLRAGDEFQRDLLPLPLTYETKAEAVWAEAVTNGTTISRDDLKEAGIAAWTFLAGVLTNSMFSVFGKSKATPAICQQHPSPSQMRSLELLRRDAERLVGDNSVTLPETDWEAEVAQHRLSYAGEMVAKAAYVCWEQIEPGLPPAEITASVEAAKLASPKVARFLLDPSISIKPRDEWPERFRKARVMVKGEDEWVRIAMHLYKRGLFTFLEAHQLIWHNGEALLNGLFGVPKGKWIWSRRLKRLVQVMRLILTLSPLMNSRPSSQETLIRYPTWGNG